MILIINFLPIRKNDKLNIQGCQQLVSLPSFLIPCSKDRVNNTVEYVKVLKEATSNENWNISNSKLQILADHTYNWYFLASD